MYDILKSLLHFVRPTRVTTIDNVAFQTHYRLTTMCLIACSIMVTLKQFFGDPINCFTAFEKDIPEKVLDNFCWMHSTFTLPGSLAKKLGVEVIAPGVEKHLPNQEKIYHKYYQWVCFFLFFQSVMFYLPHLFWKLMEGNKMQKMTSGMENPILIVKEDAKTIQHNRIHQLAEYFVENLGGHNLYAWQYFACEFLNFANVIGNMFFIDTFLGNQFAQYGPDVLRYYRTNQPEGLNPMSRIFPRVTKCTFFKFGPSGNLEDRDALCVLPLNIINEKIFIFLWFWFVFLAAVSAAAVFYRAVWLCSPGVRKQLFLRFNRKAGKRYLERLCHKFGVGDWFMVMLVSKNMHSLNFREFINEMEVVIEEKDDTKPPPAPKNTLPSAPNQHV